MEIINKYLNNENYYGHLVYGSHIDEVTEIYNNTLLIPMKSLYHHHYVDYIKYFFETFTFKYDKNNTDTFNKDYSDNVPICFIIHKTDLSEINIPDFENECIESIEKAKLFLALMSGQSAISFFKVLKNKGKIFYKTELTQYNKLHRLWMSSQEKFDFIRNAEKTIDNQNFSLSLFHDANKETNLIYKIARYFMVLESITGSSSESRKHIKSFFEEKNHSGMMNYTNSVSNYSLNIDAIEIAGIIRAKLFHGASLKYKYLKKIISSEDYEIIIKFPEDLSRHMRDLCETAFYLSNM